MKIKTTGRIVVSLFTVVLILVSSILPVLASGYDPYIGMEYDYSEKGTLDVYVGELEDNEAYYYGGSYYYYSNYCHYYKINGRTAYCCWSNMNAPTTQRDNRTKYFIGNHAARAKALYYFAWGNGDTPSGRNEKIANGLPTKFLGKNITYYKDYVQAITDYARENSLPGEFDYYDHSDSVMAYLIGHFIMDDMMNEGDGIRVVGSYLDPDSPIVYGVYKLVNEVLYNWDVIDKVPSVPSSVRIFYCFPDRESGLDDYSQGLMSMESSPTGGFSIQKKSANTDITNGNSCYSLKGAEFTVYSDSAATKKITSAVTDDKGYAEVNNLTPGTVYVKETKAPKGYTINSKIFSVNIKSGDKPSANVLEVTEQPGNDPAALIIYKNDPEHVEKDENGNDVKKAIAGAQFELSYYDADPETTKTLSDLGNKQPTRTWILESDSRGITRLGDSWKVSGDEFYRISAQGTPVVPIGCLTLKEIKTDPRYQIDPTVRFARVTKESADNHEIIKFSDSDLVNDSIDYPNHQTTTEISKKSITTQDELHGAGLKVTDKNGEVIDEWVSTDKAHIIRGLIVGDKYTLTETLPVSGYSTAEPVEFTVLGNDKVTKVVMYDDVTKYKFIKIDGKGKALSGVTLRVEEISDRADKFVEEWTTDGTPHEIVGKLVVGKSYQLIEVHTLDGYYLAEPVTFKVSDDSDIHTITMKNFISTTYISKKSITTEEELPGAELVVKDKDGNIVDEWTSGDEEHLIEGLKIGETYILTEKISPDGYVVSSDIEFTVNPDGTATHVDMTDDITKFKFIKVNEDGDPVDGAVLRIEEFKGTAKATSDEAAHDTEIWEPVPDEEWTTDKDGTPHEVNGKLVVGKRYRLVELSAPKGYNLASPVEFTVENTAEPVEVKMVDTTTQVTKTDITGENEIPGARLIVRDKDGNIVDEWISGEEHHNVENLIEGETYTLEEVVPAPGYVTASPIEFTVTKNGISTAVTMKDAPTKVVIHKLDDNNKPVSGAKLQILDKDKNVVEEWTSDGTDHIIEAKLIVGETYTLHEVSAPEGYEIAKDIEFTVKDTAEEQEVTMIDVYKGDSKISTPDQPTKSSSSQAGGATMQTGQSALGVFIALAVLVISAACIMLYRKKRNDKT